ncbi:MAG TPA: hypothetical protein VMU07_03455 [Candidatus Paceibacterota bacterium]|nr:hypothetical protein [Candidatus Paceibacterota bacterium]
MARAVEISSDLLEDLAMGVLAQTSLEGCKDIDLDVFGKGFAEITGGTIRYEPGTRSLHAKDGTIVHLNLFSTAGGNAYRKISHLITRRGEEFVECSVRPLAQQLLGHLSLAA